MAGRLDPCTLPADHPPGTYGSNNICSSRRFGIDIGSTHHTANDGFHDHYQKSMVPTGRTCSPRYLERLWQGPWVSRFLNQTTGEASAGFGVPFSTTCSWPAFLPFKAGKSKALLLPPWTPFHLPNPLPSCVVHVNAPTQGWTFHPNSRVTFFCDANLPVTSVIWYFGFELWRRTMPGGTSGSTNFTLPTVFGFFGFWVLLAFLNDEASSSKASNGVWGFNWLTDLMMSSQMIACEGGAVGEEGG